MSPPVAAANGCAGEILPMTAQVTILGAAGTVTGSCFLIRSGKDRLLVDCGLFQGSRTIEALNREPFAFDPGNLCAVLLTHAHLDHSGLLPRLYAEGFRGKIWCTSATGDLLAVMLPDAARIHEQDIERRNRRWDRADEPPLEPLYRLADAEGVLELRRAVKIGQAEQIGEHVETRFWNAGHILGSASIEVIADGVRLLFSGDIGPQNKSFHARPEGPVGVDHLFCESTYGDRDREEVSIDQRRTLLEDEVKQAIRRGGNLLIPVFALERTQELLLDLAYLLNKGRLVGTNVFVDSPLASRATEVFRRHRRELEDLDDGEVFNHPKFHFVESVDVSIRLDAVTGAVILAASGMCEGGRIRHHLRNNLPNSNSTILFVGYQAKGSLGRTILEGARRVRISGRDIAIRAQIRRLDTYSAHADQGELVEWIKARKPIGGSLFLTHGEDLATQALRQLVEGRDVSVIVPEIGETYELAPSTAAKRLRTGRAELRSAIAGDWQNKYADLAVNLKRDLQRIDSDASRVEALAQMRAILDSFAMPPKVRGEKQA
jgi:metallo-beta-lactamase family protein